MQRNLIIAVVAVVLVIAGLIAWQQGLFDRSADDGRGPVTTDSDGNGSPVEARDVTYTASTTGYFARPDDEKSYPGVVMIHEWWGLNDHIKEQARQLAEQGYMVLAVDLYGGRVATSSAEAQLLTQAVSQNQSGATANLRAAVQYLRQRDARKIASLGWCFGGGQSLQLALSGESLDATVVYYGTLVNDQQQLSAITWPVLGIFGGEDQVVSTSSVAQFDAALTALGVDHEIHVYPGVGHAFANPSGDNYSSAEAQDAWTETLTFLQEKLK